MTLLRVAIVLRRHVVFASARRAYKSARSHRTWSYSGWHTDESTQSSISAHVQPCRRHAGPTSRHVAITRGHTADGTQTRARNPVYRHMYSLAVCTYQAHRHAYYKRRRRQARGSSKSARVARTRSSAGSLTHCGTYTLTIHGV